MAKMGKQREFHRSNPARFKPGNRAAAKEHWSLDRVMEFQSDLERFRKRLGYSYGELAKQLDFSPEYVKLLAGVYASNPHRQPSEEFVKRFKELKRAGARSKKFRIPRATAEQFDLILSHILARRFKCPECARDVRAGRLAAGLQYWWARVPGQKHCPKHRTR